MDVPRREAADKVAPGAVPSAAELADAVDRGEITVAFQPKVELISRRAAGLEALARWQPAGCEPVPPDLFMPLAERHGLIVQADPRRAAQTRWTPAGDGAMRHPDCGVAVNISPLVLANPALPEEIEAALAQAGVPPGALIAEITESVVIADPVLAAEVLTRLRIKGIGCRSTISAPGIRRCCR